ncbi:hypothetical protein [Sphingomonas trueperi]|uniref:hypothetical protein n=1 Tax=Sphingomonas trueperi TaxID=53317 RepID=UPI0031DBBFE7
MKHRTEDQAIIAATRDWFENSRESIESFSTTLLIPALEDAGLAEVDRDSVESSANAYTRWRRAASMKVGRIIRGTQPFPLAWKWVWVACLPQHYQLEIRRELMAMAGSLYVPIPSFVAAGDEPTRAQAQLHRLAKEFGELLEHAKPGHNGYYDLNDDPRLVDRMMKEAVDLVEVVLCEVAAVSRGTGRPLPRFRMIALEMEG